MLSEASVYVHFPWCLRKCPYCDFVSYRSEGGAIPQRAYTDAVLRELELRAPSVAERKLVSIFFGGGTPSLWEPSELKRVIDAIYATFSNHARVEVTVECNPSSLDELRAAALVEAGVNRLSVGVQSLREHHLQYLGRSHTPERALESLGYAIKHAAQASADFIFGLPEQKVDAWCDDLTRVIDTGVNHVSAYALTIEAKTQFGERYRKGKLPMATDDLYADLYQATEQTMAAAGFEHYEVSNYARGQHVALHNMHYWQSGDYLALGTGAVGALTTAPGQARRYRNMSDPEKYMMATQVEAYEGETELLGSYELICEGLMLGLRTAQGMHVPTVERRAGASAEADRTPVLQRMFAQGDILRADTYWRVPQDKWLHLDGIVASLF